MATFPRISAHVGSTVDLSVTFLQSGMPLDPFAIRRIDIFAQSARTENLVAQIAMPDPTDSLYPLPLVRPGDLVNEINPLACDDTTDAPGTEGRFSLLFDIPCDFEDGIVYHDVWWYIPTDCGDLTSLDLDDESLWCSACNRFFVFGGCGTVDDHLTVPRFAFEPLDLRLKKGEIRTIEVGIMPLPLYDFDYNRIMPLIPQFQPTITIETDQCELLVDNAPGRMGIRQGSYRTNPFTCQFTIDTRSMLKMTYIWRVSVTLPNGEIRISDNFRLSVF